MFISAARTSSMLRYMVICDVSTRTNEVAGELSCYVAHLLADVWQGLLLNAGQQLRLDGSLQRHRQTGVDLLEGRRQQPSQEHRCHLSDLQAQSPTFNRQYPRALSDRVLVGTFTSFICSHMTGNHFILEPIFTSFQVKTITLICVTGEIVGWERSLK